MQNIFIIFRKKMPDLRATNASSRKHGHLPDWMQERLAQRDKEEEEEARQRIAAPTSLDNLKEKLRNVKSVDEMLIVLSGAKDNLKQWLQSLDEVNEVSRYVRNGTGHDYYKAVLPLLDWDNLVVNEDSISRLITNIKDSLENKRLFVQYSPYFWQKICISMQGLFRNVLYYLKDDIDLVDGFYLGTVPYLHRLLDPAMFKARSLAESHDPSQKVRYNHLHNDEERARFADEVIADETSYFINYVGKMSLAAREKMSLALSHQLPVSITTFSQFARLMWFSKDDPVGQSIVFHALKAKLSVLVAQDGADKVNFSWQALQDPDDRIACLQQYKLHISHHFDQLSLEHFDTKKHPALKLVAMLSEYKHQRENNNSAYYYFGLFKYTGAFSRSQKLAAAQALIDVLLEPKAHLLDFEHLATLKQGNLGHIIKSYLNEQENFKIDEFLRSLMVTNHLTCK